MQTRAYFLFWVSLFISAASAQTFWVTPSLTRTGSTDQPGVTKQAAVSAAKGETESFQIIVQAPAGGLNNVNVIPSDLAGPGTISQTNYQLYTEKYVDITQGSVNWFGSNQPLGAGWYPDPLVPLKNPNTGATINMPFTVAASTNQPIWVDITVPRTAAAGQYSGTISVQTSAGTLTVPVSLTVWNFAIPLAPAEQSSFAIWNPAVNITWYEELLRHRVMPLLSSNCSQTVGTNLLGNGCIANPATESTLVNSYGLSAADLRFWSGAQYGNCVTPASPSVADIRSVANSHQSGMTLYDYSFDEVYNCANIAAMVPVIQSWARNLHQVGVKNYVNMGPCVAVQGLFDDGSGTGTPAVDIWGVLPISYDYCVPGVNQAKSQGSKVWSYNTLVQDGYTPKWEIDFAPINFRIQPGFINESLGLTGLLYWRVDMWNSDPWNVFNNVGVWSPWNNYPGDGTLIFPADSVGIPGGVAPSMRLKWIRDGMDDYDYVEILKGLGQGSYAVSLANSVGPDWTNWTRDPNALYNVRNQMGAMIDQMMTAKQAPPAVTNTAGFTVTPASGSGFNDNLTISYTDPQVPNMSGMHILINSQVDGRNACWLWYDRSANTVSIAWDSTASWNSNNIGINYYLQNSQCGFNTASITASTTGNTLNLTIPLTFSSSFAGQKSVFLDAVGPNSLGYSSYATWIVP